MHMSLSALDLLCHCNSFMQMYISHLTFLIQLKSSFALGSMVLKSPSLPKWLKAAVIAHLAVAPLMVLANRVADPDPSYEYDRLALSGLNAHQDSYGRDSFNEAASSGYTCQFISANTSRANTHSLPSLRQTERKPFMKALFSGCEWIFPLNPRPRGSSSASAGSRTQR